MSKVVLPLVVCAALAAGACGSTPSQPMMAPAQENAAALMAVEPPEGAVGVSRNASIVLRFSGPMASGMEQYMDLHEGDLSSGTVPLSCSWSTDRETMTCVPRSPLRTHTLYTIHVGGGMMGANGMMVDYSRGQAMGGQWIMGGMMSRAHGGGMGWGMMGGDWRNPNGSYGMAFTFTTE